MGDVVGWQCGEGHVQKGRCGDWTVRRGSQGEGKPVGELPAPSYVIGFMPNQGGEGAAVSRLAVGESPLPIRVIIPARLHPSATSLRVPLRRPEHMHHIRAGHRHFRYSRTRRSNCAFSATMTVLSDMRTAPSATGRSIPTPASTPAASGRAMIL